MRAAATQTLPALSLILLSSMIPSGPGHTDTAVTCIAGCPIGVEGQLELDASSTGDGFSTLSSLPGNSCGTSICGGSYKQQQTCALEKTLQYLQNSYSLA
jgi:hypothetical protein